MTDERNDTQSSSPSSSSSLSFDYVVVGAGVGALGLLYGVLKNSIHDVCDDGPSLPTFSIAIVERGTGPPHDPLTRDPSQWYEAANNVKNESTSTTTTTSTSVSIISSDISGRKLKIPTGKGLGGTSNINACLCIPPLKVDLDGNCWPEPWKSTLWSSIEIIQNTLKNNKALHHSEQSTTIEDIASPYQTKCPIDLTTKVPILVKQEQEDKDGRRQFVRINYFDALIAPLLKRYPELKNNIHWITGTEAQRLLVKDDNRIYGVECFNNDKRLWQNIYANKHVFLCAGAIESPVLLLVSDIQRKNAGIGKHLKDQVVLPRVYLTPYREIKNVSLNGIAAIGNMFIESNIFEVHIADAAAYPSILPYIPTNIFRRSSSSSSSSSSTSRLKMLNEKGLNTIFAIIEATIKLLVIQSPISYILNHFCVVSNLCLMHPYSEGEIKIVHRNKHQNTIKRRTNVSVEVNVGYFSDSRDIKTLRIGSNALDRMARHNVLEVLPGFFILRWLKYFGIDWFNIYSRFFALPYYHFCSTCRMKTDISQTSSSSSINNENDEDDWVVDRSLKLRDMDGLSICDASVFPAMVSTPPALTCAALGYGLGKNFAKKQ